MRTRMVPVASIGEALQRAVRDAAQALGKKVRWELVGGETELDRTVLNQLNDALIHVVRNAVAHGIELPQDRVSQGKDAQGVVRLHAMQLGSEVLLVVADDGKGHNLDEVRTAAGQGSPTDEEARNLIFISGLRPHSSVTD